MRESERGGIRSFLGRIDECPDEVRGWYHTGSGRTGRPREKDRLRHDVPMMSTWWLTKVLGSDTEAGHVMTQFMLIENASAPWEGYPETLSYFGSHVSNRIVLTMPT